MSDFPSELRRDDLSDRWVLVAAGRAKRPHDFLEPEASQVTRDPFDPANIKPDDIIDKVLNTDGTKYSVKCDWKTIAIINAYPFLAKGDGKPRIRGPVRDGYGFHEIVVHSPDPDKNFEDFSTEQTLAVLELFLKRHIHLAHHPNIHHVQIFTNRGREAGASVVHPHSQIVALPVVPPYIDRLVAVAKHRHSEKGEYAGEAEVARESRESVRVVYENSKFLVYCPFASHADYHIRIMPKQKGDYFREVTEDQLEHLAKVLNLAFRRLNRIAGIPPYNAFIRTAPIHHKDLTGFRWHVDIIPHLNTPGGLEISTGLDVVTVAPEDAARALRQGE